MPLPLKAKIALLYINPLPGNRVRCNAALGKLSRKLNNIETLLFTWSQQDGDVRFENYRPECERGRAEERRLIAKSEGSPRSAAGEAITYYRETLNPLAKEIQREMATPLAAGKITTKIAANFPAILGSAAPRWVKINLQTSVVVQISGPRDLLDGDAWDEIVEAAGEAVNAQRRRAVKLIQDTDAAIVAVYERSSLAGWDNLNQLTPEQLEEASASCAESAAEAKRLVEAANESLGRLADEIADGGITAARQVIDTRLAMRQGQAEYRCAYKKRVVLGGLAVAGSAISLAAGIATGGGASFFGIYALVMASINVANLVRESFLALKSTQDRLLLNMSTAKTRMTAAHGRVEGIAVEVLTNAAGLMKIPTDIYGEAVGTVGEMEQSLLLYQDRAETYNKNLNELIRSLSELLDNLEALKAAKDMDGWGITDKDYDEQIAPNEVRVGQLIEQIITAREAYPNTTKLAMKASVMVTFYKAFLKDQLLDSYSSLEAVLGVIGDIKHTENTVMGIATLAADLSELTTPINAFTPTDIVDVLAMISSSLG